MKCRSIARVVVLMAVGLSACTYSKDYFRIGPDGKKIKADGPIVPGEELGGDTASGTGTGEASTGGTGGDGTITPTGGSGTAGTTGGTAGDVTGIPIYPLAIHAEEKATSAQNLYLARFSEGVLMETPKKLTANADAKTAILFPSLSPDASKIIYYYFKGTGSIFDGTFVGDQGLHLLTNLQSTPADAAWNAGDPGYSASWTASGEEVVYTAGGCGLLRKAKSAGTDAVTEANTPAGDYAKWIYFQTAASPVRETAHPAFDTILFGMFGAEGATKQGAEVFLKKAGDPDPAHFTAITATPAIVEMYPSISPDGKYVVFSSIDSAASGGSGDAPQKVTVCDLSFSSGSGKCENTRTFDAMATGSVNTSPCWSWDSSKIFFSSKDPTSKKYDVFEVDFVGGSFGAAAVNITNTPDLDEMEVSCASAPMVK